jgi:hypothetical protein
MVIAIFYTSVPIHRYNFLPDSVTAKGFNQRTIELPCTHGFPQFDISEVVNPAAEEEYQHLLDELVEL